jgi:hypothetical protein
MSAEIDRPIIELLNDRAQTIISPAKRFNYIAILEFAPDSAKGIRIVMPPDPSFADYRIEIDM